MSKALESAMSTWSILSREGGRKAGEVSIGGGFESCHHDGDWWWLLLGKTLGMVSGKDTGVMDERHTNNQVRCWCS